ncbi:zinc ribbon domain-containing protein [Vibrio sp. Of14-4]|uniref:zinc ribbon domain-containing protein n=1 Tax=Vibrio sp. Of14-4 TaxID=2724878 RepID=UPI001EF2F5DF|nr:zinc ribbon domain-containing protein [Vibrio sp. Of14-4]MCG7489954.1 zinc ribbon domain-containing protein [Vibrio sp. Of14-4]
MIQCPDCDVELKWKGKYHCEQCQLEFDKQAYCPDCQSQLEKLLACGASNYFCNQCNELKSKSKVRFVFVKT